MITIKKLKQLVLTDKFEKTDSDLIEIIKKEANMLIMDINIIRLQKLLLSNLFMDTSNLATFTDHQKSIRTLETRLFALLFQLYLPQHMKFRKLLMILLHLICQINTRFLLLKNLLQF